MKRANNAAVNPAVAEPVEGRPRAKGNTLNKAASRAQHRSPFAVPGNLKAVEAFCREITRAWRKSLMRRSQRHALTWKRFSLFALIWIPWPKILHPYPEERFFATTRGRSRMR